MRNGKKDKKTKLKGAGLTSEQRYAYWAEFSKRDAVNERAIALIDSKGVRNSLKAMNELFVLTA